MLKQMILLTAAFIMIAGFSNKAIAIDFVYDFGLFDFVQDYTNANDPKISFDGEQGASVPLFGNDIETGILQLYAAPTTGTDVDYGTSPEALNAIEPSVGVQFKIDLGL